VALDLGVEEEVERVLWWRRRAWSTVLRFLVKTILLKMRNFETIFFNRQGHVKQNLLKVWDTKLAMMQHRNCSCLMVKRCTVIKLQMVPYNTS